MKCLVVAMLAVSWATGLALATPATSLISEGCGHEPAARPELIDVDGQLRHAIVVLPDDYQRDRPHDLIFGFHGRTNDNVKARGYFGLEKPASRPTIYVYPAGLLDDSGRFTWWTIGEPADALRDFSLFDALLAAMSAGFCIDLDAVYVVGHSLGASFANSLACARGDRIRAVVSVAGGINPTACSGEVAAMLLHNPRDEAVPLDEGERARDVLLGQAAAADTEMDRRIGDFACAQYRDGRYPIVWCLHDQDVTSRGRYYPHQWPRGMGKAISIFIETLSHAT